jgi:hypothetical protein
MGELEQGVDDALTRHHDRTMLQAALGRARDRSTAVGRS